MNTNQKLRTFDLIREAVLPEYRDRVNDYLSLYEETLHSANTPTADIQASAQQLRGYLRGFSDCGVQVDQKLIWTGIETSEQRIDALEGALEQKPECLLCADDSMAAAVLQELRARHIKVPEQVKLASFYDSELLTSSTPQISAAQFDGERLGATACRMLLDILAGKQIALRQMQGYQVILRESTK